MASRAGRSLHGRVPLKTPIDFGIRVGTKGRKPGRHKGPRGKHAGQRRG